jgi:dTDP-4-amino-4,6-dideoxy-D-galactose acyltransferase
MAPEAEAAEPCELLEWDSSFFGFPIAQVTDNRLDRRRIEEVEAWCAEHEIRCAYLLADAADPATTLLAEDHGFRMVDVRVTFEHSLEDSPQPSQPLRVASGAKLEPLLPLARRSFGDTRFYADPGFPRERVDELYAEWIRASDGGPMGDAVLTAERDGSTAGAITCVRGDEAGEIGLIMVDPSARGAGVGSDLVVGALEWLRDAGSPRAEVQTQARNVGAQRLYERAGFLASRVDIWLHRWFDST